MAQLCLNTEEFVVADRICATNSHRAFYRMHVLLPSGWDNPFFQWAADLGIREGEWLRDAA